MVRWTSFRLPSAASLRQLATAGGAVQLRSVALNVAFIAITKKVQGLDATGTAAAAHAAWLPSYHPLGSAPARLLHPMAVPQLGSCTPWQCPSSAPAPPQGAPGGSRAAQQLPGWAPATGIPAAASAARASRITVHLQCRRFHCVRKPCRCL